MSLRNKRSSRPGLKVYPGGFSSVSLGSYSIPKISTTDQVAPVSINKSLLTPLNVDIDPSVQALRTQEKEQIKSLNNQFASFIEKVRLLEQQNKVLETEWTLLQRQTGTASPGAEPFFRDYIANMQKQLEQLNCDQQKLAKENKAMLKNVDDYRNKYENEVLRRSEVENDFVQMKRDVDVAVFSKMDLECRLFQMHEAMNFLVAVHDEELGELQKSVGETSVLVTMHNARDLDMGQIVSDITTQYHNIAARSQEESEMWHQIKFDQKAAETNQYHTEQLAILEEIAHLKHLINHLQHEIDVVKLQCLTIENNIAEVETRGEQAVLNTGASIKKLEEALKSAKKDMATQIKEYQTLMNVKLTLDVEIATYRRMLEEEEQRFGNSCCCVRVVTTNCEKNTATQEASSEKPQQKISVPILIKTTTQNSTYN